MFKKILMFTLSLILIASAAFACDLTYSGSTSNWNQNTSNVITNTNSFHSVGTLFHGSSEGSNYAGGQALTTHNNVFMPPNGSNALNGNATQNFGEALGGFTYSISGLSGAIAGTKGDVSQWSKDTSNISLISLDGSSKSHAIQNSNAGFIGGDAALGNRSGSFTGSSVVNGGTYSYSHKGIDNGVKFVGTASGAGNSTNTNITGNYGHGYAYGNSAIKGKSFINAPNGSTSGMYTGHFSYKGNGSGNVAGSSVSSYQALPNGGIVGTYTNVNINVNTP